MKRKAQERKEQREKEKYNYRRIIIPHVEGLSQEIRRELMVFEIPVSFKAHKTTEKGLQHPKDPIQKEQKSGVIYQINCKECDKEYIGETGRQLEAIQRKGTSS